MLTVLLLIASLAAFAVAINWAYLVTVFRHQQQAADAMSLAATPQLLDEALLCDLPCPDLEDETVLAQLVVDTYRDLINAQVASVLQLQGADVKVTPGRIDDTRLRGDDFVFNAMAPFNALRVVVCRDSGGANPVSHLINGFMEVDEADVTAASYAILDDQVVGFCPRTGVPTPLIPLAIQKFAFDVRNTDANGNAIYEFELKLNSTDPLATDDATGAMLELQGNGVVDITRVQTLVAAGEVTATDLPGGKLGPVGNGPTVDYPSNPAALPLPAEQDSPAETEIEALVAQLLTIAASSDPVRIFPVYSTITGGDAQIVGFVAAQILAAVDEAEGGMTEYQRLKVTIEPRYLIHTTAWTDTDAEPRDMTIRKLRLIR